MIPKHNYVRSKKLLKLVASLDCQHCGSGHMVQAAHTNWDSGQWPVDIPIPNQAQLIR